jgi:predicted MFS family arabinose efflux permease
MTKSSTTKSKPVLNFTGYQKFMILLLALLQFTVVLDFMILAPLGDILMKDLKMSTHEFGKVVSAYAISAGLSGILAAGFADKFDRKKLLLFFYVGFILGTLFCGLALSYNALYIARIVTGLFGGVIGSIGMAIVTDLFDINQRGRVMGFIQMAFAGSQILGVPIGLVLANHWSWHMTFYMVVGLSIALALLTILRMRPVVAHLQMQSDKKPLIHLLHTIRKREYRVGFLATALLSLGGFMLMPFTSAFIVNNVHISQTQLPLIFFCTGLASMAIMPIVGRISDKTDKFRLFTFGSLLAMVMVNIYTNLPPVQIGVVIAVNVVMFMGIMSRMVPATTLNSAVPGMADRGAYMSINASLQQLSGGVAAYIAGLIVVRGTTDDPIKNFDVLGYIMSFIMLATIWFMYRVDRMLKNRGTSN